MKVLTSEGREHVHAIASKYDIKPESVESLLHAVIQGNGSMAQFNIDELGGSGQWMRGGMTQVGDLFNSSLRATVDKICNELSDLASSKVLFEETVREASTTTRAQTASNNENFSETSGWPAVFGHPTASGSQNDFRYAYFAPVHRLVIDEKGKRTIYDTKHHEITGVSQQQGFSSSHRFTSQEGDVDLNSLSVISEPGHLQPTPQIAYDVTSTADLHSQETTRSPQDVIMATIEKVNILFERGQISEEEFKAKKKELLDRL